MFIKKSKKGFHNSKKVIIDGIKFASKLEGDYYLDLKNKKISEDIRSFELQPKFIVQDKFVRYGEKIQAVYYIADFLIFLKNGDKIVVDVKGMATETSKLKRKLYLFKYDIPLKWICKFQGEWVDYFENEKRIKNNKKARKALS